MSMPEPLESEGGPAFPFSINEHSSDTITMYGMSLRDWFAGQALVGSVGEAKDHELRAWFGPNAAGITSAQIRAARAYDVADAMLARRNKLRSA